MSKQQLQLVLTLSFRNNELLAQVNQSTIQRNKILINAIVYDDDESGGRADSGVTSLSPR